MALSETQEMLAAAIGPLMKLSRAGYRTTICGAPAAGQPVGEGLSEGAIELLDEATRHPNIFIDFDSVFGIELFRAGLLSIYVGSGQALYEPTAIAKRDGREIVADHRRRVAAIQAGLRACWDAYVAEPVSRRDLVPFSDVLREFGPEVAYREARAPAHVIQQEIREIFAERGYVADPEVRS